MNRGPISDELRRKGVAAETIRFALGDYIIGEPLKILAKLSQSKATLEELLAIQSEAKAYMRLKHELDSAIGLGTPESEKE